MNVVEVREQFTNAIYPTVVDRRVPLRMSCIHSNFEIATSSRSRSGEGPFHSKKDASPKEDGREGMHRRQTTKSKPESQSNGEIIEVRKSGLREVDGAGLCY